MNGSILPNHIAIIPDGNRRWAKEHHVPSLEGHRRGADVAIKISRKLRQMGVHTLSWWAFSTENWNRPPEEIKYLMDLYEKVFDKLVKEALKDEARVTHLGRKDRIPEKLAKKIADIEAKTKGFTKNQLNMALDYGGRDEVLRAVKKISEENIDMHSLTEENFEKLLDTGNQLYPNPDVIIRTSGEKRTSGLMIWQAAYAEYFFLDKYFPELTEQDIENILEEFADRERRFGK